MKNRSEQREIIIKVLYQIYIYEEINIKYNITELINEQTKSNNSYVNESIDNILKNKEKIYEYANKYLIGWTMNRLNKVDQAILSLAIYELMYTDIPSIVSINEAIELSKKYSDEAVTKIINGVLDKIYHAEKK